MERLKPKNSTRAEDIDILFRMKIANLSGRTVAVFGGFRKIAQSDY
jgi:hypothetical protein